MASTSMGSATYQQQRLNESYNTAMTPGGGTLLSSDPSIQKGQLTGIARGTDYYGQNYMQTGQNIQNIIQRRRAALNGQDPASTEMRQGRNREIAMARSRGASEGQVAQIARDTEGRIDKQRFERQDKTLSDYQKLIGNVLAGQTSLEQAYAGLEKSGEYVPPPTQSSGTFGSVICTELYNQGILPWWIYKLDADYGERLRREDPYVYAGYIAWAPTVVRWMQKSRLLTRIVAIPAMAWAKNMAGQKNIAGSMISKIGEPICRYIGRKNEAQNQAQQSC